MSKERYRRAKYLNWLIQACLEALRNKKSMIKRIFRSATVYFTIILLLSLTISHSSTNSTSALNSENNMTTTMNKTFSQINDSFLDRPILDLAKDVNDTEINPEIEEWIFVNITIKNIGNQTAYNLTTVDPSFSDWAISSLNLTTQRYVMVEPNATIYYYYYFKPLSEGNFTLEPTTIEYYGIDETKFNAQSQRFIILSIEPANIVVLDTELWLNILYYSLAIVFGIGALVLIDYLVFKRPREVKKKKEKQRDKKGTVTQRSKKQIKRKTKKRR